MVLADCLDVRRTEGLQTARFGLGARGKKPRPLRDAQISQACAIRPKYPIWQWPGFCIPLSGKTVPVDRERSGSAGINSPVDKLLGQLNARNEFADSLFYECNLILFSPSGVRGNPYGALGLSLSTAFRKLGAEAKHAVMYGGFETRVDFCRRDFRCTQGHCRNRYSDQTETPPQIRQTAGLSRSPDGSYQAILGRREAE
jgi:hypothetical protein